MYYRYRQGLLAFDYTAAGLAAAALFLLLYHSLFCVFLVAFWPQGAVDWMTLALLLLTAANFTAAGMRTKPRLFLFLASVPFLFAAGEESQWGRVFFYRLNSIGEDNFMTAPRDMALAAVFLLYFLSSVAALHPKIAAFFRRLGLPKPRLFFCGLMILSRVIILLPARMFNINDTFSNELTEFMSCVVAFMISGESATPAARPVRPAPPPVRNISAGAAVILLSTLAIGGLYSANTARPPLQHSEKGDGTRLGIPLQRPPEFAARPTRESLHDNIRGPVSGCYCFSNIGPAPTVLQRFGVRTNSILFKDIGMNIYGLAFMGLVWALLAALLHKRARA